MSMPSVLWLSLALLSSFCINEVSSDTILRQPVNVSNYRYDVVGRNGGYAEGFAKYLNSSAPGGAYTVCMDDYYFDQLTTDIWCKNFGYPGGGVRVRTLPPAIAGTAIRDSAAPSGLTCLENSTKFSNCVSGELQVGAACAIGDIVYLRCYGPNALRLVDGKSRRLEQVLDKGRLQIFVAADNTWMNVCSKNFRSSQVNVDTSCRLLGFPLTATSKNTAVKAADFDPQSNRFNEPALVPAYMSCTGQENSLVPGCISGDGPKSPFGINEDRKTLNACLAAGSDAALHCLYQSSAWPPLRAIVGGVIAAVVVVIALAGAAFYFITKKGGSRGLAENGVSPAALAPPAAVARDHIADHPANGDAEQGLVLEGGIHTGVLLQNGVHNYESVDARKALEQGHANGYKGHPDQSQPVAHGGAAGLGNTGTAAADAGAQQPSAGQDAYVQYLGQLLKLPGK